MLLLLAIYQELLHHLFKITHFHTILLVPISIHNLFQTIFSPLIENIQSSAIIFHPHIPSTTTQTIPRIQTINTQPQTNALNIHPSSFNPSTTHTLPPTNLYLPTSSTPTYINSATSISEPIKPFDGLDHNYTPEEYLQHIEARVTFLLGLQPTTVNENKFWHARRMAFIQCSLTGTALGWYIRLNDTYKQDWNAFVQAFKKQFSSQKNAYYAQVEALSLTKKGNETVRHFALKVQQLVEKGWCNEIASTINLKCNEIFTKGLPKNLEDFAKKRQVKQISIVLEPSIPFHTLVKLVDAEDIANDKRRTHDLTIEVNKITKQLENQTLESQQSDQIMYTQPRDPNNKTKPAYKKYCSYCHRTNTPSQPVSKNNEMMKINVILMNDQSLLNNLLFNIFVLPPMIKHHDMNQDQMTLPLDIIVEIHLDMIIKNQIIPNIDYDLLLELATIMIEILLLHIIPCLGMTTIKEILVHIVHFVISSYRSPYRRDSRPRYKSRFYSRDNNFQRYTSSYRPRSRPRDSRYSRSRSHSCTRNKNINI